MSLVHLDDIRAWRHANVPVFNDNKLKLGIFGLNCSNGCTRSAPGPNRISITRASSTRSRAASCCRSRCSTPYLTLINAGSSQAGREFSARHVDYNFITITTPDEAKFLIKDVGERAAVHKRKCGVMTYGLVCCRDTEAAAREAYDNIVRHGDWQATENSMKMLGMESSSFGKQDTVRNLGERFIAGWGG